MTGIIEIAHVRDDSRVLCWLDDDGEPVGVIAIDVVEDQVGFLGVAGASRRQGIATSLLRTAREITGLALDMDYGERSADGDAWARSVGLRRGPIHRRLPRTEMEDKTNEWLVACRAATS